MVVGMLFLVLENYDRQTVNQEIPAHQILLEPKKQNMSEKESGFPDDG